MNPSRPANLLVSAVIEILVAVLFLLLALVIQDRATQAVGIAAALVTGAHAAFALRRWRRERHRDPETNIDPVGGPLGLALQLVAILLSGGFLVLLLPADSGWRWVVVVVTLANAVNLGRIFVTSRST